MSTIAQALDGNWALTVIGIMALFILNEFRKRQDAQARAMDAQARLIASRPTKEELDAAIAAVNKRIDEKLGSIAERLADLQRTEQEHASRDSTFRHDQNGHIGIIRNQLTILQEQSRFTLDQIKQHGDKIGSLSTKIAHMDGRLKQSGTYPSNDNGEEER